MNSISGNQTLIDIQLFSDIELLHVLYIVNFVFIIL